MATNGADPKVASGSFKPHATTGSQGNTSVSGTQTRFTAESLWREDADAATVRIDATGQYVLVADFAYRFVHAGRGCVGFEARAENDITVGLSDTLVGSFRSQDGQSEGAVCYEAVIGGWLNTKSALRRRGCTQIAAHKRDRPDAAIASRVRFERYWFALYDGVLTLGRGDPGTRELLRWSDPVPIPNVRYVGFTAWNAAVHIRNLRVYPGFLPPPLNALLSPHVAFHTLVGAHAAADMLIYFAASPTLAKSTSKNSHALNSCSSTSTLSAPSSTAPSSTSTSSAASEWPFDLVDDHLDRSSDVRAVPAHRVVLAAASPVIRQLVSHPSDQPLLKIALLDVDVGIGTDFLSFIYTGCLDTTQFPSSGDTVSGAVSARYTALQEMATRFGIPSMPSDIHHATLPSELANYRQFLGSKWLADVQIVYDTDESEDVPSQEASDLFQQTSHHAHRALLSCWSEPLYAMLVGQSLAESRARVIRISNVQPYVFAHVLHFMYTAELSSQELARPELATDPESLLNLFFLLLELATRFCIPLLRSIICERLEALLDTNNAARIFAAARIYDCAFLASLCAKLIAKHFPRFVQSPEFARIDIESFATVLRRDDLAVSSEIVVWEAILSWIQFPDPDPDQNPDTDTDTGPYTDANTLVQLPATPSTLFVPSSPKSPISSSKQSRLPPSPKPTHSPISQPSADPNSSSPQTQDHQTHTRLAHLPRLLGLLRSPLLTQPERARIQSCTNPDSGLPGDVIEALALHIPAALEASEQTPNAACPPSTDSRTRSSSTSTPTPTSTSISASTSTSPSLMPTTLLSSSPPSLSLSASTLLNAPFRLVDNRLSFEAASDVDFRTIRRRSTTLRPLLFTGPSDENGACFFAGTGYTASRSWTNPHTLGTVRVSASSLPSRYTRPEALVDRSFRTISFATAPAGQRAWWALDFGPDHSLQCNHYVLRHDGTRTTFLRNWRLEASIDKSTWVVLREHLNDNTLSAPGQFAAWPVHAPGSYRHFRIHNIDDGPLVLMSFEFYGYFA